MDRQDRISATAAAVAQNYFAGRQSNLDPAFQPGGIAAQTARQPLTTATQPGQGTFDVVGRDVSIGLGKTQTQWTPLRARSSEDLFNNAIDARSNVLSQRKNMLLDRVSSGGGSKRDFAELRSLEAEERTMDAHQALGARMAEQQLRRQKTNQVADEFPRFTQALGDITETPHTPEYERKVWDAIGQHPNAAQSAAGARLIGSMFNMKRAPTPESIAESLRQYEQFGKVSNLQVSVPGLGKVSIKGGGDIPESVKTLHAKTIANIQGALAAQKSETDPKKIEAAKVKESAYRTLRDELEKSHQGLKGGQSTTPQTAAPATAPSTPTIQVGTKRTINGTPAHWDGKGWIAVQ